MGTVFDTCCYQYSILDGINQGWLVPIKQKFVQVGTLDYSQIKALAGDLCASQLAEVLRKKNLHGMIHPTLEWQGTGPPSSSPPPFGKPSWWQKSSTGIGRRVQHGYQARRQRAQRIVGAVCRRQVAMDGQCGSLSRGIRSAVRRMCRDVHSHEIESEVSNAGRGTRPLTPPQSDSCATTRKQAIDQSSKPDLLVLDFGATLGGTALSPRSMCWQAGHPMIG